MLYLIYLLYVFYLSWVLFALRQIQTKEFLFELLLRNAVLHKKSSLQAGLLPLPQPKALLLQWQMAGNYPYSGYYKYSGFFLSPSPEKRECAITF
jgi:hypothetical protein